MRSISIAIGAALALAGTAHAADAPTRESYVAKVERICAANTAASQKVVRGARGKINKGRLAPAGRQIIRASRVFAAGVRRIDAVPRPPADDRRLRKWIKFLRIVAVRLRLAGKTFVEGNQVKANHRTIHVERSGNAANNVGFVFGFRHCRLSRATFNL